MLKPREQKLIKVEASFIDEISGLGIIKILDKPTHSTIDDKNKIHMKFSSAKYSSNGLDTIILDPKEVLGIIDLRSLGYYKIKQGTLQQHLSKYYRFKRKRPCANSLINL